MTYERPDDFLNYVASKDPLLADIFGEDPEGLYEYAVSQGFQTNYDGEHRWTDVDNRIRTQGGNAYGLGQLRDSQYDKITSPTYTSGISSMLDGPINEHSWAWARKAYNDSLTGLLEQAYTGQSRYNIDDYEPGIINNILSGVVSFMMPADLLTMRIGSFVGKGVVKKLYGESMEDYMQRAAAEKGISWTTTGGMGAGTQATTLAAYEGAMGGVNAYLTGDSVLGGIAKGVSHGALLGGMAGFVGGGVAAKGATAVTGFEKALTGQPAQITYEAGVFTGAGALEQIGYGDYTASKLLEDFVTNVGMFGLMRIQHKTQNEAWNRIIGDYKNHRKFESKDREKEEEMIDRATEEARKATEGEGSVAEGQGEYLREKVEKERSKVREEFDNETRELDNLEKEINDTKRDIDKTIEKLDGTDRDAVYEGEWVSRNAATLIQNLHQVRAITKRLIKAGESGEGPKKFLESDIKFWKTEQAKIEKQLSILNGKIAENIKTTNDTTGTSNKLTKRTWLTAKEKDWRKRNPGKEGGPFEKYRDKKTDEYDMDKMEKDGIFPTTEIEGKSQIDYDYMRQWADSINDSGSKKLQKQIYDSQVQANVDTGAGIDIKNNNIAAADRISQAKGTENVIPVETPKGTKTTTQNYDFHIKRKSEIMKDVRSKTHKDGTVESDKNIVLDYMVGGETPLKKKKRIAESNIIADFVNWWHKRDKTFELSKADEVHIETFLYENYTVRGVKITSTQKNPLMNFFTWMSGKYHLNALEVVKKTSWEYENLRRGRKTKSGPGVYLEEHLKGVDTKVKKSYESLSDKANTIKNPTKRKEAKNIIKALLGLVKTGIRSEEVNRLSKSNIVYSKKEGWYIDFGVGEKGDISLAIKPIGKKNTPPGVLPISESLANHLLNMPTKDAKSPIFNKDYTLGGRAIKNQIAEAVFGEGYTWTSVRTLLRTVAKTKGISKEKMYDYMRRKGDIEEVGGKQVAATEASYIELSPEQSVKIQKQTMKELGIGGDVDVSLGRSIPSSAMKNRPPSEQGVHWEYYHKGDELPSGAIRYEGDTKYPGAWVKTNLQLAKDQLKDYKIYNEAERKEHLNWVKRAFPHLSVKLRESLGFKDGDRILGKIAGHLIQIDKNRAHRDTIPHEVTHHVVDVLKMIGSNDAYALIKRGEKLFGSEEKLVQAVGEYVTGRLHWSQKGMVAKAKHWVQNFWNITKSYFTGVENLSSTAIASMIGNKVLRGNINVSHYSYMKNASESYKTIETADSAELRKAIHDANGEGHALVNKKKMSKERDYELREEAGWLPRKDGKFYEADATYESIKKWVELVSLDNGKGSASKNKIADMNIQYGISEKDQKFILSELRVKNLDIDNATPSQINRYVSIIKSSFTKPLKEMDNTYANQLAMADMEIPKLGFVRRSIMNAYDVLKKYGGDPGRAIANKLGKIEWLMYTKYKGFGDKTIYRIRKRIGRRATDAMWVIDKDRSTPLYKDGKLTKLEKEFYENMDKPGHKFYEATQEYRKMMDFFYESFHTEVAHWATPDQVLNFRKQFSKKYVQDYFTRRLTPEFLKEFSYDGHIMNELVEANIKTTAEAKAIKNGFKRGEGKFDQKVNEYVNDPKFIAEVKDSIWQSLQQSRMYMSNNYLKERGVILPEYKETSDGRKIRVMETKFENTIEEYVNSMSKYLAVLRFMPEYTSVGRKFGIGETAASKLDLIKSGDKDMAWYAKATIERELGLEGTARDRLKKDFYKTVGAITNVNAMAGLSSPLSGVKNVLIQIPRSVAVYGTMNTMAGIAKVLSSPIKSFAEAREKGQLEYGTKQLAREAGESYSVMKTASRHLFKWNLMGITEQVNRMVVSHAGKLHYQNLLGKLRGEHGMFKISANKKRIRRYLHETLEMSDSDIRFLETTKLKTAKDRARFDELLSQAEHYSHVKSAGGTSTGLLPLWGTSPEGRAATLFMRMAYVTTVDSYKNIYRPAMEGNIMPLVKAAIGHGLSGYALYNMYDYFFDVEPPHSHSTDLDIAMQYLWRGEFAGVVGEVISPYGGLFTAPLGVGQSDREVSFIPIMEPIILRNLQNARENAWAWIDKTKSWDQALEDWLTRSVVVAGQFQKYINKQSPHYSMDKRIKTLRSSFMNDKGYSRLNGSQQASEKAPYYRNLKNAIYFGNKEDVMREAFVTYDFLMDEAVSGNTTSGVPVFLAKLHRQIVNQIVSSSKWTSPLNNLSVQDLKSNRAVSKRDEFLRYLKQGGKGYEQDAITLDKHVQYQARQIKRMLNDSSLRKKYSNFPNLSTIRK